MPQSWLTILYVVGSIATLLGLWFSFWAWHRARGAEEAAREAKESIRHGNAAEDLQTLATRAKDLLASVENNQMEAARLSARDLVLEISKAKERWQGILAAESRGLLNRTGSKVSDISRALLLRGANITGEEREKLLDFCHDIVRKLGEEAGKILFSIEKGEM